MTTTRTTGNLQAQAVPLLSAELAKECASRFAVIMGAHDRVGRVKPPSLHLIAQGKLVDRGFEAIAKGDLDEIVAVLAELQCLP